MSTREKPCDVVLGTSAAGPRRALITAGVIAALVHVAGATAALAMGGAHQKVVTKKKLEPLLVIDHVIDLAPEPPKDEDAAHAPQPEVPPPARAPKIKQPKAAQAPKAAPEALAPPEAAEPMKPPSEPPPAAQAAQVVAAPAPGESSFALTTGSGASFAGGTTSASGTGTRANHTSQVGAGNGNGWSKARAPQLHSRSWPCGWPSEADDLDTDEAFVTLKATIAVDGSVQDVQIVSDPGHGFAKRAALCARTKVKFDPALDAEGKPVAGVTPPLRIRFVRDEE